MLLLLALLPRPAAAGPILAPLVPLPPDRLRDLGPLLVNTDLALLEANDKGQQRQITTLTLCAAPPEKVRDVVIHPERYGEFVRNMTESRAQRLPDGTLDHSYRISYTVHSIWGRHRYVFLPPPSGGGGAPVEMYDPDDNGNRHYRWEFLPYGQGTLIVLYGYTFIPYSGVMERLMSRVPTLEYGLALITQMTWLLSMKNRAQVLSGPVPMPPLQATGAPRYGFMLDRGLVVLFRSRDGRLQEISMIDRVRAQPDLLLQVIGQTAQWSSFIPSITRSLDLGQNDRVQTVELEQSLPLLSFRTTYGVRMERGAVDMMGLSGDLRGGRLRWDVRADGPAGKESDLVLRTTQAFDRSSIIVRQLYRLEPLLEYGIDVGLTLVIMRGIKARAEQLMGALGK